MTFVVVGKNHDLVRVTVDGISENFLIKLGFLKDFVAGLIPEVYALQASDSEEWKSRGRK